MIDLARKCTTLKKELNIVTQKKKKKNLLWDDSVSWKVHSFEESK